jgi:hypothetical protein
MMINDARALQRNKPKTARLGLVSTVVSNGIDGIDGIEGIEGIDGEYGLRAE